LNQTVLIKRVDIDQCWTKIWQSGFLRKNIKLITDRKKNVFQLCDFSSESVLLINLEKQHDWLFDCICGLPGGRYHPLQVSLVLVTRTLKQSQNYGRY